MRSNDIQKLKDLLQEMQIELNLLNPDLQMTEEEFHNLMVILLIYN